MIEGNLLCHLNFLRHTGDKFSCHRLICGLFRVGKSPEVLPLNALSVTHFDSRERILLQYEGVSGREAGALSSGLFIWSGILFPSFCSFHSIPPSGQRHSGRNQRLRIIWPPPPPLRLLRERPSVNIADATSSRVWRGGS